MKKYLHRGVALMLAIALLVSMIPEALAASYTGTINEDKVFFRMKPNTSSDYHTLLKKNTKVTVTGTSGDFYAVTYDGNKGYVMKKFVTLSSSALKALNGTAAAVSNSKYASAKTISALGTPPDYTQKGSSGDSVEKLQQALKIKGYFSGTVDGKYGDMTVAAVKAYQKAMGLSQTGKADYATIMKLFGKVLYTTVANDPQMNGITKISQITVPATSEKGNSGKNVLALQQALKIKGFYKAPIDSKYGDQTVEAVKAFQKSKGLTQDGKAGNDTIKALFGKNASNYTYVTERLDWFSKGVNVFTGQCVYTVKDVNTGKTFRARRRFGSNHLDSEPLTASDTAVLKSLYGGEWSWNRRAILVLYNGHVYAASMNGMPHGTSTITNNNFDGHFCIHFYKSRTHGTNRVDEAHQNCVSRAMSATW
ncbi:MAG: peptidoglycan-binding protein [Clostridia bacterium]|nr:peptidoglycan-binding protein [Clostridia bacterium]MBR0407496.1 peptidoglycan-binding protein [Clostridia bacterium]